VTWSNDFLCRSYFYYYFITYKRGGCGVGQKPVFSKIIMASIKITNNKIIRKIHVDDNTSWEEFTKQLSKFFTLDTENLMLTYMDHDKDMVTLSTMAELQDAIHEDINMFYLSSLVSRKMHVYVFLKLLTFL
jgi:PB1 domain